MLRLWRVLKPRLIAERMTAVMKRWSGRWIGVLARMERRGISIDRQVLSRLSGEFAQTAARVEAELQEIAGEPINVGSSETDRGYSCSARWAYLAALKPRPRMVDICADPRRARRAKATNSEEDLGMAAGFKAE